MSIEKKSLISTLKTTKKANVANTSLSADGIIKSESSRKGLVGTRKGLVGTRKGLVGTRKGLVGTRKGLVGTRKGLVGKGKM
jgi:hypothetical protein